MPTKGVGEFIIAKHRNGALESVRLSFKNHLAKFTDLDAFDFDDPLNPLGPSMGFEETGPTITLQSKMNDEWDNEDLIQDDIPDF